MHDDTDADGKEVAEEVVEVITTAKIIVDEVSTTGGELNAVDEEPESTTRIASSKAQVKDKGKAKLVEEPKVLKLRKAQIAIDEEVTRRIEVEWNGDIQDNIDWNKVVKQEGPEMDVEKIKAPRKRTRKDNVEKDQTEAKELKRNLEIVPDDKDNVFVNVAPLSSKPPTIVDYKIYKEGKKEHF
nr:hypothetical protein [Tanacetum cinerariifolium]